MTTNQEVIDRYIAEAGKENPKFLRDYTRGYPPHKVNVYVSNGTLYSYGEHFPLAEFIGSRESGFFLLNGDTYSATTSQHQTAVRLSVQKAGTHQYMIVPFTALRRAGLISERDRKTINPIEIREDRWIDEKRRASEEEIRDHSRMRYSRSRYDNSYYLRDPETGIVTYHRSRHVLGASVFEADIATREFKRDIVTRTVTFLSGFDDQETRLNYFLCELPEGVEVNSVDEAFEALKPDEVKRAEAQGIPVVRQGDIFAIPVPDVTFKEKEAKKGAYLLGTNHTATRVVERDGHTFAKGILWHKPAGRDPDHVRRPMGDREMWHLIVKNTVPAGRSWSLGGRID